MIIMRYKLLKQQYDNNSKKNRKCEKQTKLLKVHVFT